MDNNEFDRIYNNYAEMLYKIAYLYFGNSNDSEDAVQEIFIKLLYKSPDFKDENHEKAWLIKTAQTTCKDMLKKSHRKDVKLEEYQAVSYTPGYEKIDIIQKIVKLKDTYKLPIILYYYYGYSVSEIASTLKISNSSVKMRLKRAREILKIELEDYSNETG